MTERADTAKRIRALVVHPDAEIREGWARSLAAAGLNVFRCAGPTNACTLLRDGRRCPLHDEADIAIYERSAMTPEFLARLRAVPPAVPIVIAVDALRGATHEPLVVALASRGTCRSRPRG